MLEGFKIDVKVTNINIFKNQNYYFISLTEIAGFKYSEHNDIIIQN